MSEGSVESPKNLTVPNSNSVTSFIEKNKWIIGGVVSLIVLYLLYRFYFKKAEKFSGNNEGDVVAVEDSEQFSQNEDLNLGEIKEGYESDNGSEDN